MTDGFDIAARTEVFMRAAGQLSEVGFSEAAVDERMDMLGEEFFETDQAATFGDLVEYVDGLIDVMVVAWGSLVQAVGPVVARECVAEVLDSNDAKVDGRHGPIVWKGEPHKSKVKKPRGWRPPDVRGVLTRAGWDLTIDGRVKRGVRE